MVSFTVKQKKVQIWPSSIPQKPVVYLHTFSTQGEQVHQWLCNAACPDFSLVAISGLNWESDMVPWDAPPLFKNRTACTGGADDYLQLLCGNILPLVEEQLPGLPAWRAIAGYSLAGLFALYSFYQTDFFSRGGSMSGSLWFPKFKEYLFSHQMKKVPDRLYFSLGNKEHRTRNPLLQTVQQNTEEIEAFYHKQGIDTVFQLNPGNHYQDTAARTAAGILWLLGDSSTC